MNILRNFTNLVGWVAGSIFAVFVTWLVVMNNYLGLETGIELLNWEKKPLWMDEFLGLFFQSYFKDATLGHLSAMATAAGGAAGIFLLTHLLSEISHYVNAGRVYRLRGDETSASETVFRIKSIAVHAGIVALLVVPIVWYELVLYRYRSIAAVLGIDDPATAALGIKSWALQLQERPDLFAWDALRHGVWACVALTAISAFGFEFSLKKAAEALAELMGSVTGKKEGVFVPAGQPETAAEEDEPVPVGAEDEQAEDGIPPGPEPYQPPMGAGGNGAGPSNGRRTDGAGGAADWAPPFGAPMAGDEPPPPPGNGGAAPGAHSNAGQETSGQAEADAGALRDVIGGRPGEKVRLDEARVNPRYYVDPDTQEVWNRTYHETLHSQEQPHGTA